MIFLVFKNSSFTWLQFIGRKIIDARHSKVLKKSLIKQSKNTGRRQIMESLKGKLTNLVSTVRFLRPIESSAVTELEKNRLNQSLSS